MEILNIFKKTMDSHQNQPNGGRNMKYNQALQLQALTQKQDQQPTQKEVQKSWRNRDQVKEAWSYSRDNSGKVLSQNTYSSIDEHNKMHSAIYVNKSSKEIDRGANSKLSKGPETLHRKNSNQSQIKINKNNLAGK